jgi:hypothetical protein
MVDPLFANVKSAKDHELVPIEIELIIGSKWKTEIDAIT